MKIKFLLCAIAAFIGVTVNAQVIGKKPANAGSARQTVVLDTASRKIDFGSKTLTTSGKYKIKRTDFGEKVNIKEGDFKLVNPVATKATPVANSKATSKQLTLTQADLKSMKAVHSGKTVKENKFLTRKMDMSKMTAVKKMDAFNPITSSANPKLALKKLNISEAVTPVKSHSVDFAVKGHKYAAAKATASESLKISNAARKESAEAEFTLEQEYNASGTDYATGSKVTWKTQRGYITANGNKYPYFLDMIPLPTQLSSFGNVGVMYSREGNTITVPAQKIAEGGGSYLYFFSGYSEDGSVVMTIDDEGKLTTEQNECIIYGAFNSDAFDPSMDTYEGYYGFVMNVSYSDENGGGSGNTPGGEMDESGFTTYYIYTGRGTDPTTSTSATWTAKLGTLLYDGNIYNCFRDAIPLPEAFTEVFDNVDLLFENNNGTITIPAQGIAQTSKGTIFAFSGVTEDGSIMMTIDNDGKLTTAAGETIVYGLFSGEKFDPTLETYLGYYEIVTDVKYSLGEGGGGSEEGPDETGFTTAYKYKGTGVDQESQSSTSWTMKLGTLLYDGENYNCIRDVIPNIFVEAFPNVDLAFTIEGNTITVPAQMFAQGQQGSVFAFSGLTEDGSIVMTIDNDGKLTTADGEGIIYGVFSGEEFDPTLDTYLGYYEMVTDVKYTLGEGGGGGGEDPEPEENEFEKTASYTAVGWNYFDEISEKWNMEIGVLTQDSVSQNVIRNVIPSPFSNMPDIYVNYYTSNDSIIIPAQAIGRGDSYYVILCSGITEDGSIRIKQGDEGKLTVDKEDMILYGAFETAEFDPTYESFLGAAAIYEKMKLYKEGEPIIPEVMYEPDDLCLHIGMSESGYSYTRNMAMIPAYGNAKFVNTTSDGVDTWLWSVTKLNYDKESETYSEGETETYTTQDLDFVTEGGKVYSPAKLQGTYQGQTSATYAWAKGSNGLDPYVYAGCNIDEYTFPDKSTATFTKANPDNDVTIFSILGTPAVNPDSLKIVDLIAYQGKPSAPLYIEGTRILVRGLSKNSDFNLVCQLVKCTREGSKITLGDVIAESNTVKAIENGGISAIDFTNFYLWDEDSITYNVDHLFINDEFAVIYKGWGNGTFDCMPFGEAEYNDNGTTSTYFIQKGKTTISTFTSLYQHLYVGFLKATYGFLLTDNNSLAFSANGGDAFVDLQPMLCTKVDAETSKTRLYIDDDSDYAPWVKISVDTADYSDDNYKLRLKFTTTPLPEGMTSRSAKISLFQEGARQTFNISQSTANAPQTTGIQAANSTEDRGQLYNLSGQRVSKGYKGIVIRNGNKFINK